MCSYIREVSSILMRPSLPRTFAIILGTVAVFGAIATTCAKLELERRRFKHDKETALLLEEARQKAMELDRLKFQLQKERFSFDREMLSTRQTSLSKSVRQRAEHDLLRISTKNAFTHSDASDFVQQIWEGFLSTEAIGDDSRH